MPTVDKLTKSDIDTIAKLKSGGIQGLKVRPVPAFPIAGATHPQGNQEAEDRSSRDCRATGLGLADLDIPEANDDPLHHR